MIVLKLGKLNKRVQIIERKQIPDGVGGSVDSWVKIKSVWAGFERPRIREDVIHGSKAGLITQGIRIRRLDVSRNWRIEHGGVMYEIIHVDNSVSGETMITAKEVAK